MKYFSMFSGIGGFEHGIDDKGECVGFSEINKEAIKIYKKHFKHKEYGNAERIIWSEVGDFEWLVGGFPCQAFSIAGIRKGFNDTRGTLFFEVARCLKEKRPKYFLLENVKGLLSHDNGRTFKRIMSTFTELGYNTESMVFDSINFNKGRRKRVFMFGTYREQENDVRERAKQAVPFLSLCSTRSRITSDSIQESRRSSERIIRTFARLPDWLDSWDSFYA